MSSYEVYNQTLLKVVTEGLKKNGEIDHVLRWEDLILLKKTLILT